MENYLKKYYHTLLYSLLLAHSYVSLDNTYGQSSELLKLKIKDLGSVCALFFGGFQALMPFIGWFLGKGFESYITSIDHWIAFILLGIIGGKMLIDGIKAEDDEETGEFKLDLKELFLLAIATSIDALAVGITFTFLNYPIVECMSIIGCTTFIISFIGVYIGKIFGSKYEHKAEIAGGIILIVIGLKILLEHLGIF
ncbi:MAG: manganese efflux pump MntP family protein [Faecalibacillus intestinalis]